MKLTDQIEQRAAALEAEALTEGHPFRELIRKWAYEQAEQELRDVNPE